MEIKFKGISTESKNWVHGDYAYEFERGYNSQGPDDVPPRCTYIGGIEVDSKTVGQFLGRKDSNDIDIFGGDIIKFYLCYGTSQTHTGDNIPNGSYTEPDESQLVEINGQVFYDEENAKWSWGILGDSPYQMQNAFQWVDPENEIAIIGRNFYHSEEIKEIMGYDDMTESEYNEILNDHGFENESDLMKRINTIEVIGNIYQNK